MNIQLNLISPRWQVAQVEAKASRTRLYCRGTLSATTLQVMDDTELLCKALCTPNGFYAFVNQTQDKLIAGVDHVRSIPLFYSLQNGTLYLSDNAEWVRVQVGDQTMDPIAQEEFLLSGYVTGSDTLYPRVKQIQAGEFLIAKESGRHISIETNRYYRFLHSEPYTYDEAALSRELNDVATKAMRRLVDYAAGRQIVLPLSGGHDSRLLAIMLKKLGYDNVLCFTYGVIGNREAEFSRKVAEALGFEWVFVPYSEQLWAQEWASEEARNYCNMASNHVSLPHIQDWLAIKLLREQKTIKDDAVVVPGHSGDFVAGSHIPGFVFTKAEHSEEDLLQALASAHLANIPISGMQLSQNDLLNKRIRERIDQKFEGSDVSFANLYELWDWQERQSKYIVNSIRVYDQFELDWWLPLWDLEFVLFWENVPLRLRKERLWFKVWINQKFKGAIPPGYSEDALTENAGDPSWVYNSVSAAAKLLPASINKLLKRLYRRRIYNQHFLAFEGLVDKKEMPKYISKNYNIIGMYSDSYLRGKWNG